MAEVRVGIGDQELVSIITRRSAERRASGRRRDRRGHQVHRGDARQDHRSGMSGGRCIPASSGVHRGQRPPAGPQPALTVFAAASLSDAFAELGREFEAAHPGARVRFNFAGSQQLVLQLEQGARADIFASADRRWMEHADSLGILAGPARIFARNTLVITLPRGNPAKVAGIADLARPGVKLVLAAEAVPAGRYAREALRALEGRPGYPPDFGQRVLRNVVSEEENVRSVVAKVELGEADAGIVYRSDVTGPRGREVGVLPFPPDVGPSPAYPIAQLRAAASAPPRRFSTWCSAHRPKRCSPATDSRPPRPSVTAALPLLVVGALPPWWPCSPFPCSAWCSGCHPRRLVERLGDPMVLDALRLSLVTSAAATVLVVTLGLPVAWLLATRRFPGKRLLEALVELPMVLPPTVAGVGLLMAFGRTGLAGRVLAGLGVSLPFTTAAVVLAQAFVALRSSSPPHGPAWRGGSRYLDTAATLRAARQGSSGAPAARRPVAPRGAAMTWAGRWASSGRPSPSPGTSPGHQTMPLAVFLALQSDLEAALALSVLLLAVSLTILLFPPRSRERSPRPPCSPSASVAAGAVPRSMPSSRRRPARPRYWWARAAWEDSLLRLIAGLDAADSAVITLGGCLARYRRRRGAAALEAGGGYLPQDYALFPHLSVGRSMPSGCASRACRGQVHARRGALRRTGVADLADRARDPLGWTAAAAALARHWRSTRASCCWTGRWRRSTRPPGGRCGPGSALCSAPSPASRCT
jgi:molybdate transport system substrate-binding protein